MPLQLEVQREGVMLSDRVLWDARADGHVAASQRYSSMHGRFGADWKRNFPLDCLHYCYPGPSDYWAKTLYNLLMNNAKFAAG